jgi:type I restriction enzyme S subunit
MKWPILRLEKLAAKEKAAIKIGPFGSQLKKTELVNSGIHVVGIENVLSNKFDGLGNRFITYEKFQTLSSVEVKPGDILITMMGTIGKVAIVPNGTSRSIMDSHLLRFRPNLDLCTPEYIAWLIKGNTGTLAALNGRAHGAIMKGLNSSIIKSLPATLPPYSEQRRIVKILDQADRLRKLRADADAKARQILPALFIKMFGDPAANKKKWPIEKFGNVGTLERGKSKHRPRNDPVLLGGSHPLIQTGDVANSGGRIRSYTQTYSDVGLSQSRMWPRGTLCITIAPNIAKTGILEFDSCFPDSVVGFNPRNYVTTEYVQSWLWFLQPVLENNAPQAAQRNINLQVLKALPIPIPPQKLQKKFSKQAEDLNNQENNMQKVSSSIENIFRSLLYRAFKGDLTTYWRETHMKELLQEMEIQAKELAS